MREPSTGGRAARYLAGGTYGLLAVYQMLATHYIIQFADPAKLYLAWQLAVGSIAIFAAMAVWMFAGGRALCPGPRRGILVGTLLYVLYQLLTHEAQTTLIQTAVYQLLPGLYEQTLSHYIFLLARLLLAVLAAFFAMCSRPRPPEAAGAPPAAYTAGTLAVEEEITELFTVEEEEITELFTVEEEEEEDEEEPAEDEDPYDEDD